MLVCIRIERFGCTFCPDDKVMQIENDYDKEVYDADLGSCRASIGRRASSFFWRREAGQTQTELVEYGPTSEGEAAENWRRSEGRMRNPAGYRATGWSPLQTHTPWREGRATRRRCAS